jgi:hypothetical protein
VTKTKRGVLSMQCSMSSAGGGISPGANASGGLYKGAGGALRIREEFGEVERRSAEDSGGGSFAAK